MIVKQNDKKSKADYLPFPLPEDSPRWKAIWDLLPEDDNAKIVERQVNRLDRTVVDRIYRRSGSTPYDPMAMLKMVLYQYLKGNQSPAKWRSEALLHGAMQWLGRGYVPARRTWYDFRDRMAKIIEVIHRQIVQRSLDEGHVDPTTGVQDGTAMAACASRHRMVTLATLKERQALLQECLAGRWPEHIPQWVPLTSFGLQDMACRVDVALMVLEERIAENAKKPSDKRKDPKKIRVSLSDPVAPLGRDKQKVFRPLYTVQYVVAPFSYLILAYCCEADVTDVGTLIPMIDKVRQLVDDRLRTMLTDASYCSILDLRDCRDRNVELLAPVQANSLTESKKQRQTPRQLARDQFLWQEAPQSYRCPQGHELTYHDRTRKQRHGGRHLWESRYRSAEEHCSVCLLARQCLRPGLTRRTITRLEDQALLDAQREKMARPDIQQRYKLRGQTVERMFADGKWNRGFTRFHGRGLTRVRAETGLIVVAQNLQRLDRLERKSPNTAPEPT